jgi:hypothetical protein
VPGCLGRTSFIRSIVDTARGLSAGLPVRLGALPFISSQRQVQKELEDRGGPRLAAWRPSQSAPSQSSSSSSRRMTGSFIGQTQRSRTAPGDARCCRSMGRRSGRCMATTRGQPTRQVKAFLVVRTYRCRTIRASALPQSVWTIGSVGGPTGSSTRAEAARCLDSQQTAAFVPGWSLLDGKQCNCPPRLAS